MLPVVVGDARAANAVLTGAWLLIVATLVPALFGLGPVYVVFAVAGGAWFLVNCHALAAAPGPQTARTAFRASLVQLVAVLGGAMLDVALR
jgi:protoheme IX farnesyltransferase